MTIFLYKKKKKKKDYGTWKGNKIFSKELKVLRVIKFLPNKILEWFEQIKSKKIREASFFFSKFHFYI